MLKVLIIAFLIQGNDCAGSDNEYSESSDGNDYASSGGSEAVLYHDEETGDTISERDAMRALEILRFRFAAVNEAARLLNERS